MYYILLLVTLLIINSCDDNNTSSQSVNQLTSNKSLRDTTYSNRALSILSIADDQWMNGNYDEIENDTFLYRMFFKKSLTLHLNFATEDFQHPFFFEACKYICQFVRKLVIKFYFGKIKCTHVMYSDPQAGR